MATDDEKQERAEARRRQMFEAGRRDAARLGPVNPDTARRAAEIMRPEINEYVRQRRAEQAQEADS